MNMDKINIDFFKNLLFSSKCACCNRLVDNQGLCADCWSKINWISEPKCRICGAPFVFEVDQICAACLANKPYFDKAVSVFVYNERSKSMILKFKHQDATYMYEYLANLMYKTAVNEISQSDVIVPVPVSFIKRLKRKYNQSELLACELRRLSNIAYEPRVLKKIKQTMPQEGLSGKARRKNVIGSFGIDKKFENSIADKNVLLIDDVFTTGATVNECAKVLKEHKAKTVKVITLARVIL
ncbi:MAG: ComF family protein [Alphaproteobacteria bacterium]|nr:ComF family protein [Alphaproteobacteria bacterium]